MTCLFEPAGFGRGPRMLNMLLMPISLRTGAAYFIAPWSMGAKRNPMPASLMHCSTLETSASMLTPSARSTSALPLLEDTDLLPSLATGPPAAEETNAAAVDMLNVMEASPPVPHVSITSAGASTLVAFSRMTLAEPVISSTVSPFIRQATRSAPIWAGLAPPVMTSFITEDDSSSVRSTPLTIFDIASFIMALSRACRGISLEEVTEDVLACPCEYRFRVELNALYGKAPVAQAHYLVHVRPCAYLKAIGQALFPYDERMVPVCLKGVLDAFKDGPVVVVYHRGLAVHEARRLYALSAEGVAYCLMPQADAEERYLSRKRLYRLYRDACLWRVARPRRDDYRRRGELLYLFYGYGVVPLHQHILAQLHAVLAKVEGKGIVVVYHQYHFRKALPSPSPRP